MLKVFSLWKALFDDETSFLKLLIIDLNIISLMQNILSNREIKLIGFDADDTLWKNENLFFDTQNKIKNILKQK